MTLLILYKNSIMLLTLYGGLTPILGVIAMQTLIGQAEHVLRPPFPILQ